MCHNGQYHQSDEDPDGDVDLVPQRAKEVISHVDGVLKCLPTPPRLNFRRSNTQQPCSTKGSKKGRKGKQGAPEPEPSTESEPEPVTEALEPDVYRETPTIPEALAIPEEPSDG
jgi:hypothetical protein